MGARIPARRAAAPAVALLVAVGPIPLRAQATRACAECHADAPAFATHADTLECLTCHHIGFSRRPEEVAARRDARCRSCHVVDTADAHTDRSASCTSCHVLHTSAPPGSRVRREEVSARCGACHRRTHVLHDPAGARAPLCSDCHRVHDAGGDPVSLRTEACLGCHADPHPPHDPGAPDFTCTSCHDVRRVGAPASPSSPERAASRPAPTRAIDPVCLGCHEDLQRPHSAATADGAPPACMDCHDLMRRGDVDRLRTTSPERCGACHAAEAAAYRSGAHARAVARGATDAPTCTACHTIHAPPALQRPRLAATRQCLSCHAEPGLARRYGLDAGVGPSYARDFHGETMRFLWAHPEGTEDAPDVLVCADCHGAHDVAWDRGRALAGVCRDCHDHAPASLAGAWLGHEAPGPRRALPVWAVKLFYSVLIPFMLLGLFIHIVFDLRTERRHGARLVPRLKRWLQSRRRPDPAPPSVRRFSRTDRFEHFASMLTFGGLVVTGLPQTRPDSGLARGVIAALGGITTTRLVHRTIGVLFVALLAAHVVRVLRRALRTHRLPIMVPTRKDFEDTVATVRHHLFGAPAPRYGKFDPAEKFEYWGLFLGSLVMSATGLILLFPEAAARVLPGEFLAAGRVMHGLEATFAVLVVALWHSWGVVLRPAVFPLDTTIFTGRMEVERLREEHPAEYERLFAHVREGGGGHGTGGDAEGRAPSDRISPAVGAPVSR